MSITLDDLREALAESELPSIELREHLKKLKGWGAMRKLAQKSGVSPPTLSRIKNKKHPKVKFSVWVKLSKAEPKIPHPLADFEKMVVLNDEQEILFKNYNYVNKERRGAIKDLSTVLMQSEFEEMINQKKD